MNIFMMLAMLSNLLMEEGSSGQTIDLPGGSKMEFASIPPGSFMMGSPDEEANRDADEGPQHQVTISRGYYLGRYEVTQRQWIAVMGSNPSVFRQSVEGEDPLDRPVDSVSWQDAQRFIERLHVLGLGRFRLPTEAEWEYAARAGTTSPYAFSSDVHQFAWANSRSMARTHPVGQKGSNAWGLSDMHGNVWEWCSDWYAPYTADRAVDPTGPPSGKDKVFRGGSWYDFPYVLRSANRHRHAPDLGFTSIGFRLVLDPPIADERVANLPGGIAMRFVSIPAGEFTMGSPSTEVGRAPDEAPMHRVTISRSFLIGVYEVTQAQWMAVMGENPSVFFDDPSNPVEMVSWDDSQEFLRRLNALNLGGTFRLPTEAEWEYAARAGSTTAFGFGDDPEFRLLQQHAWFYSRAEGRSHPVGLKKPNAWGLYDMHGGVWEWCSDWFAPFADDQAVTDPQGPATGTHRVIRGGSWFNEPEALRSANRHRHSRDSRQTNLGLRVVWILP
jgi:formylglycine-generating enzyme required for sulfatase activity